MKRYWWVNHRQTMEQEVSGGYLWSPKVEANGARSQFYANMRLASPGDQVLSYAHGKIGFIGTVTEFALSAPKPNEFAGLGENWANEGWLLPVMWERLPTSVRPKNMLEELRPHLPKRHSPIQAETGDGNQKAYLAAVDEVLYGIILAKAGVGSELLHALSSESHRVGADMREELDLREERKILLDTALSETEKEQTIRARRGQGEFRRNVCKVERCCRITGVQNQDLLVASHIKPWRSCASSDERLDGHNGFLMAPHVDRLFDRGFIAFRDDGQILVSPRICVEDIQSLGLLDALSRNVGDFAAGQKHYINYHRTQIFLSNED
jgi:putative restriction endonuclease